MKSCLVTGGKNAGDFLRLLGNGREFGLKHLNYTYQEGEGGIAEALGLAEHFADGEPICVILGDNIIENERMQGGCQLPAAETRRKNSAERGAGCSIALEWQKFKATLFVGIEEKPKAPKSNKAVVGIYLYDNTVFEKIRRLKPSGRGELEITDVNNFYVQEKTLTWEMLEGWWTDAGTFTSLLLANTLVAKTGANNAGSAVDVAVAAPKASR